MNKGDVLFLARGHRNYAIPLKNSLENTIAASYFFILRLEKERSLLYKLQEKRTLFVHAICLKAAKKKDKKNQEEYND